MEEQTITSEPANKVKLMKMSKGYQWEITVSGEDLDKCVDDAHLADLRLRETYPND